VDVGLGAYVLFVAGIPAVVGAVVRRWWLLGALFGLWAASMLLPAIFGGLHSDQDTPTTLVILSFLYVLIPAEVGAALGIALGRLIRPRRPPHGGNGLHTR